MTFTDEQKQTIEDLAGLNYTIKHIAMYLDINVSIFYQDYNDQESEFRYHYDRGKLLSQADIDMQSLQAAKEGNMTAMQQFEKVRKARHFENERDRILNGD